MQVVQSSIPGEDYIANPEHLSLLARDERLKLSDPRRALYLDTETSGLAGGTGTLPFLIGMAWLEGSSLRIRQLLLRRPGEEAPMLHDLATRLGGCSFIVTYNGKSFDWPLLRNRFVMNRLGAPLLPPHVDLLHCARRVLGQLLPSMSLSSVERGWLGMHRDDDILGSEIPERYFAYLRSGNGALLFPVVRHNAADIAALPNLLGKLVRGYESPRRDQTSLECLAYASLAFRAHDYERARAFAQQASHGEAYAASRALQLMARFEIRAGNFAQAGEKLMLALQREPCSAHAWRIHLGLAKLYEHRFRDYSQALVHARCARDAEDPASHAARLRRLQLKLQSLGRAPN